jgi:hypothetical protein
VGEAIVIINGVRTNLKKNYSNTEEKFRQSPRGGRFEFRAAAFIFWNFCFWDNQLAYDFTRNIEMA